MANEAKLLPLTSREMQAIGRLVSIAERLASSYEVYGGVNVSEELGIFYQIEARWYTTKDDDKESNLPYSPREPQPINIAKLEGFLEDHTVSGVNYLKESETLELHFMDTDTASDLAILRIKVGTTDKAYESPVMLTKMVPEVVRVTLTQ